MTMNRRAFFANAAALAALTAAPGNHARSRPGPEDDDDEDLAIERERRREAERNAADYRLLLPPLWEVNYALEQTSAHHRGCDGSCEEGVCVKAEGMMLATETFGSLIQCEASVATQEAALRDKRRSDWHVFPGADDLRILAGLLDLLGVLDEVLARHKDCSCRLCRDAASAYWTVELYRDVMDACVGARDEERVRAEVRRRKALCRRPGLLPAPPRVLNHPAERGGAGFDTKSPLEGD